MTKCYFYYAEVSEHGSPLTPVWVGDGIAELNIGTVNELRHKIRQELIKHVSSTTGIATYSLNVIVKQFNPL